MILFLPLSLPVSAQFVFYDNFNRTVVSPGGLPAATYSSSGTSGNGVISITNNTLQIANGSSPGRQYITANLSGYSAPFNSTLSANADTITWAFNAQMTNTSTPNGFGNGNYAMAVVLAGTTANLMSTNTSNTGYAVVYGGSGSRNFRLVKFSKGLSSSGVITNIINTGTNELSASSNVASIQVKFVPSTRRWLFYTRDNATAWTDPYSGTLTQRGTATVDSTYANAANSIFGFFYNFGTNNQPTVIAKFDDFSVNVKTSVPGLTANPVAINFGNQWINTPSQPQTFDLLGAGLTGANITVNMPSGFQVSANGSTGWGSSLNAGITNGMIPPTVIYIRFNPSSHGTYSGNISFSGGSVGSPPTVALAGICNTFHYWVGTTSPPNGAWSNPINWSLGKVPLDGDSVIFNTNGSASYSVDYLPPAITLRGLTVSGTAPVNFASLANASSITLSNPDSALRIFSGSSLTLRNYGANAISIGFNTSIGSANAVSIAGNLLVGWDGATPNGGIATYAADNSITYVMGILTGTNRSAISSDSTNLIFENGGQFNLIGTALYMPMAKWNFNSTCLIKNRTGGTLAINPAERFYHFVVDCDQGVTRSAITIASGELNTIYGDLRLNKTGWDGTNTQALKLGGSNTLNIYGKLIIRNDAELEFPSTSTINLYGDSLHIDGNGHFKQGSTLNLNFNRASGTQYFYCTSDTGLVFAPSRALVCKVGTGSTINTVKLCSRFKMTNSSSLAVLSGSTLDCGTNIVSAIVPGTQGTFTLNSGGTLLMGSPDGITVAPQALGNIQTSTARTFSTGAKYGYYGLVPQVTGNGLPATVSELIINNSSTGVTLTNSVNINDLLKLQIGVLTTGPDSVIMNNFAQPNGGVQYPGNSSSYVNGYLTSSFKTSASLTRTLPIGDANYYTPVTLILSNITTQGKLTSISIGTDHPNINSSNFNPAKTVNRHYKLNNAGIVLSSYIATFNYSNSDKDPGLDYSMVYAGKYLGTNWNYPDISGLGPTFAQVSGITSGFGDFQLGECGAPPSPDSAVASLPEICTGESTILTLYRNGLSNIENVSWFIDSCNGNQIGTGNNITVAPGVTTTFYARYDGSVSCSEGSACRSVTVTVNPQPVLSITNPTPVCYSTPVTTDLTQAYITAGSSLFGAPLQYFNDTGGTSAVSNPAAVGNGTYYIRASLSAHCFDIKPVLVSNNPNPVLVINNPAAVCSPSTVNLTQAAVTTGSTLYGGTLSYWNDAGATSAVGNPASVNSGTYYIRVTTAAACTDIKPVTAQVNTTPNLVINPPGTICGAAPQTYDLTQASLTSGSGLSGAALTYWTNAANTIAVPNPASVSSGRYYIKAETVAGGCTDKDSVDIILQEYGQWLGVNTNWNDAQNWCGGIPDQNRDVTIKSGLSNYPVLSNGSVGQTRNLTIQSGASLNISGNTIKIKGTISNSGGTFNLQNGSLELTGTTAQTIAGSQFLNRKINNLILSNSTVNISGTAGDSLLITGLLSFGNINNATLNTGNNLTLVSDSTATASVADLTNGGANSNNVISGNVTVERYISLSRKWQLLSIPTNTTQTISQSWQEGNAAAGNTRPGFGTMITDSSSNWSANGFDYRTPGGPSMKTFIPDTSGGKYVGVSGTSTAGINISRCYMAYIRGDRSATPYNTIGTKTKLRTTGPLKQGTQASITVPANTFVDIGNPFASAIDINNVSKPGVQDFYYLWDPMLGGAYGAGGFQIMVNGLDGNYYLTPGGGSYPSGVTAYNFIQSGQGFFVRGANGGSVILEENDKATGSRQVLRPGNPNWQMLRANLRMKSGDSLVLADGAMLQFGNNFSNEVNDEDGFKLMQSAMNVSIRNKGNKLAIDRRRPLIEKDTIFLHMTGLRAGEYEWEFDLRNMRLPGRSAILVDQFSGNNSRIMTDGITQVAFSAVADPGSRDTGRFFIILSQPKAVPLAFISASAMPYDNSVRLEWTVKDELVKWQFEIEKGESGNEFATAGSCKQPLAADGKYSYSDNSPDAGSKTYRIKAVHPGGIVVYSDLIRMPAVSAGPLVSVYPNPVKDRNLQLRFRNAPAGSYSIEILGAQGYQAGRYRTSVHSGEENLRISLNRRLPAGNYMIRILGPDGSNSSIKLTLL